MSLKHWYTGDASVSLLLVFINVWLLILDVSDQEKDFFLILDLTRLINQAMYCLYLYLIWVPNINMLFEITSRQCTTYPIIVV